jgi:hypothetical protein
MDFEHFEQFPGIQLIILEYAPFEYIRIAAENLECEYGLAHLASKRRVFKRKDIFRFGETSKEFIKGNLHPPVVDREPLPEDILWGFISNLKIYSEIAFIDDPFLLGDTIKHAIKCDLLTAKHLYVMFQLMDDFFVTHHGFGLFLMPEVLTIPKGVLIYKWSLKEFFNRKEIDEIDEIDRKDILIKKEIDKDFVSDLVTRHGRFIADEKKSEDDQLISKTFESLYEKIFSHKKFLPFLHRKTFSEIRHTKQYRRNYNPERLAVMEEVVKRNSRKRKDRA